MDTQTHYLDDGTEVTLPAGVRVLSLDEWAAESLVEFADSEAMGDYVRARYRLIGAGLRHGYRMGARRARPVHPIVSGRTGIDRTMAESAVRMLEKLNANRETR